MEDRSLQTLRYSCKVCGSTAKPTKVFFFINGSSFLRFRKQLKLSSHWIADIASLWICCACATKQTIGRGSYHHIIIQETQIELRRETWFTHTAHTTFAKPPFYKDDWFFPWLIIVELNKVLVGYQFMPKLTNRFKSNKRFNRQSGKNIEHHIILEEHISHYKFIKQARSWMGRNYFHCTYQRGLLEMDVSQ